MWKLHKIHISVSVKVYGGQAMLICLRGLRLLLCQKPNVYCLTLYRKSLPTPSLDTPCSQWDAWMKCPPLDFRAGVSPANQTTGWAWQRVSGRRGHESWAEKQVSTLPAVLDWDIPKQTRLRALPLYGDEGVLGSTGRGGGVWEKERSTRLEICFALWSLPTDVALKPPVRRCDGGCG